MNDLVLTAYVRARAHVVMLRASVDERGEGVISAAIAVLIMAFLGAAMWVAFKAIFDDAADTTAKKVCEIGDQSC